MVETSFGRWVTSYRREISRYDAGALQATKRIPDTAGNRVWPVIERFGEWKACYM